MADSLRITILGCGSSGGVPRIGNIWGACDPANAKNRRRRCAALVERGSGAAITRVLIDTGPDLREQLVTTPVTHLDGVLITHEHADHTHGFDDLRQITLAMGRQVDVWLDEATSLPMRAKFAYCFATPPGSNYPPIVHEHRLHARRPALIAGAGGAIEAVPFELDHGDIPALGFRIGGLVYAPDVRDIPAAAEPHMRNADVLIIDALRYRPHPSHFSVDEALHWIERLKPRRAILTNLHIDLDYAELAARLPPHVVPAHDGMTFNVSIDGATGAR